MSSAVEAADAKSSSSSSEEVALLQLLPSPAPATESAHPPSPSSPCLVDPLKPLSPHQAANLRAGIRRRKRVDDEDGGARHGSQGRRPNDAQRRARSLALPTVQVVGRRGNCGMIR